MVFEGGPIDNVQYGGCVEQVTSGTEWIDILSTGEKAVNAGYLASILIAFTAGMVYSYAQVLKKKQAEIAVTVKEVEVDSVN